MLDVIDRRRPCLDLAVRFCRIQWEKLSQGPALVSTPLAALVLVLRHEQPVLGEAKPPFFVWDFCGALGKPTALICSLAELIGAVHWVALPNFMDPA
jgi:hypothetical protein